MKFTKRFKSTFCFTLFHINNIKYAADVVQ